MNILFSFFVRVFFFSKLSATISETKKGHTAVTRKSDYKIMSKRAREEAETKVSTPTKRPRLRINNPFPVLMNRVFGRRMPHFTVPKNANHSQNIGENVLAHNGKRIYGKCTHDDYCVTYKDSNGQDKHVYRHATLGKFDTFLKDKVSSFSSKLTAEIHVDMEKSKILKDGPHCIVHSNALFNSKKSIVKYSQCNSDTVMEGIIHCAIQEYMQNKIGSITAIPALYKVGVIDSDRIAVVMEQVQAPTVFSWLLTVPQRPTHASTNTAHGSQCTHVCILRMAQCNWDSFRFQQSAISIVGICCGTKRRVGHACLTLIFLPFTTAATRPCSFPKYCMIVQILKVKPG